MSADRRLAHLHYGLLVAMTLVSFGGPFLMLVVVRGGPSALWPPDRPVEWITIAVVISLAIVLFSACVTIGWWCPPPRRTKDPHSR